MSSSFAIDHVVDCRGMLCPMPIIRLRQALDRAQQGQVLQVLATDPASVQDMPAFARNTGHDLLESTSKGSVYEYLFRKAEAGA
ncbi:MAG TPA: sulfurtransferase TusA family protein [Dehalococcoidia bacterium]|nr:sulfurtransferase TusA family protein [Dehalococcoidia bacterium]